jgi:hypothetical protein
VHLPLEPGRDYELTLRMGRLENGAPAPLSVRLNGVALPELELGFAERLGSHRLRLPAAAITPGADRLELRSDAEVTLWYLRIGPAGHPDEGPDALEDAPPEPGSGHEEAS